MDYLKYNLKQGYKKIYKFYELNNHIMTLGLDIYWRKKASKIIKQILINENRDDKFICFDLCVGTGEFLEQIFYDTSKIYSNSIYLGVDFSFEMLSICKQKKVYKNPNVFLIIADVGFLPFKNNKAKLVTISLGIRNLKNPNDLAIDGMFYHRFKEIYRVICEGGYFCGLETSRPPNKFIRTISDFFTLHFSTNLAKIISGDFKTYTYLAKSIVDFLDAQEFKNFLLSINFKKVDYYLFTFGVVSLHIAQK
ncbi:MAG: class I SAM-dependent methyltransferase [bacterium]